ncbi:TPA: hypothetical protein ACH3X2_002103 [Trebouxia sp. C0005]
MQPIHQLLGGHADVKEYLTVEDTSSAAADFQDSFHALERDSDADVPAVTAQHDAAAWDVQSASVASANSLAGDSIKLDGGTLSAAATSLPGASPANGNYWKGPPLMRPSFTVIEAKQGSSIAPACTLACHASEALQQPAMGRH